MDIVDLFSADSKNELKNICNSIVVNKRDLISLVVLSRKHADIFPYHHAFERRDIVPNDIKISDVNLSGFSNGDPKQVRKVLSKLGQLQVSVERSSAHLFYTATHKYWHLFYFDTRDRDHTHNHWSGGRHIHYISHLCTNRSCQEVWSTFCEHGKRNIGKGGFHIRFSN